jgi:RNA polymerase sigma factor (sigma-70 family)
MNEKMTADEDIIKGCLHKDVKSQESFYHCFAGKMYGICLRYASNAMDAEDILQEGFIRAFSNLHHFRFEGSIEGWVRKIMVNTAINFYKKEIKLQNSKVDLKNADGYATLCEDALSKLSKEDLLMIIHRLPVGCRTVFNLYVIEGYTHKEIGLMLGISDNTSKSQLFRAKRAIRKELLNLG